MCLGCVIALPLSVVLQLKQLRVVYLVAFIKRSADESNTKMCVSTYYIRRRLLPPAKPQARGSICQKFSYLKHLPSP